MRNKLPREIKRSEQIRKDNNCCTVTHLEAIAYLRNYRRHLKEVRKIKRSEQNWEYSNSGTITPLLATSMKFPEIPELS